MILPIFMTYPYTSVCLKFVHYICLLNFDNALNSRMKKELRRELPVGKVSSRWIQPLVASCQVVNVEKWNENFPKWPLTRITD